MPIYGADINCDVTAASQSVNGFLYNYLCGHNDSGARVDLTEGDKLAGSRVSIINELNNSLGTQYEIDAIFGSSSYTDSVVITDCPRADFGICVLTPNSGNSTFTLDTYHPDQSVNSSLIRGSCFFEKSFDPLSLVNHPLFYDDYVENFGSCDEPQGINVTLKGDVIETMQRIEELRYPGVPGSNDWFYGLMDFFKIAAVISANWFGVDIRHILGDEWLTNSVSNEPNEIILGAPDGATAIEPASVNVMNEVEEEPQIEEEQEERSSRPATTKYAMPPDDEVLRYTAPYLFY